MYPYLDLAASRMRDFEQRAADYRLAASLPRCRRRRSLTLINALRRVRHRTPIQARLVAVCCA